MTRVILFLLMALILSTQTSATDRVALPPETESFESPNGAYSLLLEAADGKATPRAVLQSNTGEELWARDLPHRQRPRIALVDNHGASLLIDEWRLTPSKLSIMVINRNGETLVTHSYNDVAAVLGVSRADLAKMATDGPWLQSRPRLGGTPQEVLVDAAGKTLRINLTTGNIFRFE